MSSETNPKDELIPALTTLQNERKGFMARFQFEVREDRADEIRTLMSDVGIESNKDLFDNALTLFEWAVDEVKKGNTVASIDESKNLYRELQMPVLRAAAAKARGRASEPEKLEDKPPRYAVSTN